MFPKKSSSRDENRVNRGGTGDVTRPETYGTRAGGVGVLGWVNVRKQELSPRSGVREQCSLGPDGLEVHRSRR